MASSRDLAGCLLLLLTSVTAFNVDTENFVRHRGEPGSMFGFSVAGHRERGASWVLVGAPEAQTSQPGVTRGGAVFRCDVGRDDACQLVSFDRTGNNNNSEGAQIDKKSYQWFGATVRSSGEDGVVVACAPRYVWYSTNVNRRDPVGTCYTARNQFTDFAEYSPCRTRNWGYHRQGSCQAGLGASVSKDGKRLYVGAVGSWYWQGQMHSIDSNSRLPFLPPRYTVFEEGQLVSQNLYNRPDVLSTNEGPAADDDSYLGYSVISGNFGSGGDQSDVAVGMPRGAGLLGKIVLYTWNTTNLQNITGEQLGAYFGYALAAVDVDGDGLDDLVIGAPLYTDLENNEGNYETGRVYIVYQGKETYKFRQLDTRDGKNSKSRFGLALTSLGDINKDGFGDFAVGAPYDGKDERGAVYIYHGSAEGVREKYSQLISAEQINAQVSTFGFSLAGGVDLDENEYPDMVVGAYESDTSVFLRSRPVVKMSASVAFSAESKQVVLEERNCTLKDYTRVSCLTLKACLEYSGAGVDQRLELDVQFVLDSKKPKSPRLFFLSEEGRNVMNQSLRLDKNNIFCKSMFVYIKPGVRDKLTAIEAEMRYGLRGGSTQSVSARRRVSRALTPVLDLNEALVRRDSVTIQKNCGKDNVCIPDLRLIAAPSVKRYLLGSGERLYVDVLVQNEGEDSFESTFEMTVPQGINYVNIERIDQSAEIPVQCSAPAFINNFTLHCDIGNPLPREKLVHFKVLLQPFHKEGMKPRYEFSMAVNSTNPENKTSVSDNLKHLSVPIWVETDLILQGSSHPADVHYNTSLYQTENITQESEIGPQVVHIYSIRNKGPSDILEAEAHFLWPSYTLAGDHLLYLLEQPEVSGPVRCEFVENVNEEKLKIDRKRKSYLESNGIGTASGLSASSSFSSSSTSGSSGVVIEQSSTAHKSSSGSSTSFGSSSSERRGGSNRNGGRVVLTAEEHKKLEEAERKRDEEEAVAETGDSSVRYSKRVKEQGSIIHQSSRGKNEGGGRLESSSHSRGSDSAGYGTTISERGRVETSGQGLGRGSERREEYNRGQGNLDTNTEQRGASVNRLRTYDSFSSGSPRQSSGQETYAAGNQQGYEMHGQGQVNSNSGRRIESGTQGHVSGARIGSGISMGGGTTGSNNSHFYEEERQESRNTTWTSADGGKPRTVSQSSWRINEDGVVRNGSTTNIDVDEQGRRLEVARRFGAGGVAEGSAGLDRAAGGLNKTNLYEEERRESHNTTWNSRDGGNPRTYSQSSWRINEDGVVRNGSSSNVHEGTVGSDIRRYGSSGNSGIDQNLLTAGRNGQTISEERSHSINTKWDVANGEDRIHHSSGVDGDGSLRRGSTSFSTEESVIRHGGTAVDSAGHHDTGARHESSFTRHESGGGRHESGGARHGTARERQGNAGSSYGSSGLMHESSVTHHENAGERHDSSGARHGSTGDRHESSGARYGTTGTLGVDGNSRERTDGAYNVNIADLTGSRRTSNQGSSVGGLGNLETSLAGAARGPSGYGSGVARTYALEVEGESGNSGSTSHGSRHYSSADADLAREASTRQHGVHYSSAATDLGAIAAGSRGQNRSHNNWDLEVARHQTGGWSDNVTRENIVGDNVGRDNDRSYTGRSQSSSWSYSSSSAADGDNAQTGGASRTYSSSQQQHTDIDGQRSRANYQHSRDNVDDSQNSGVQGRFKLYPRYRRQAENGREDMEKSLQCGPTKCTRIKCVVGPLTKDQEAWVAFRSRVWVQTLKKFAYNPEVHLSSLVAGSVTQLPHLGAPEEVMVRTHEVPTQVLPRDASIKPEVVPLWVVVLSACAGALILMLLVYLLWKCGFFKRNRPSDVPEKQPLNRNGHYQTGDEAL